MDAPAEIFGVSHSQFSVARHYGGMRYAGADYRYDAARDVLVRRDVWARRMKDDKDAAKSERDKWERIGDKMRERQGGLF